MITLLPRAWTVAATIKTTASVDKKPMVPGLLWLKKDTNIIKTNT